MDAFIQFLSSHGFVNDLLMLTLNAVVITLVVLLVLWAERKLYRKLLTGRNSINLRFVEGYTRFLTIFIGTMAFIISTPLTKTLGQTLFSGTAIITAIAGLAAQPVLSDMICGMVLSGTRPFNIGDRVELDDGTAGIVKDITVRHVVVQGQDTIDIIIPNSRLNSMVITNMSATPSKRSIRCRFDVAYSADIDRAIDVVSRAIQASPYTLPGLPGPDGGEQYAPVCFLEFAESSLVLATTVYFAPACTTAVVRSDVNTRVKRALDSHGIEIPYRYVNVVMNPKDEP